MHAIQDKARQLRKTQTDAGTSYLESKGFTVMRFWNHEVLTETEAMLEKILNLLVNT